MQINVDMTKGIHSGTQLVNNQLTLIPKTLTPRLIGNWDSEGNVTMDGYDVALIYNHTDNQPQGAVYYIYGFQPVSTLDPITFRAQYKAENVSGDGSFMLYMDALYEDDTWHYEAIGQNLDVGTYEWKQVSATFTPLKPIKYLYPRLIHKKAGKVWFRFPELFQAGGSDLVTWGSYESEPVDLYRLAGISSTGNSKLILGLKKTLFYYDLPRACNGYDNVQKIINTFAEYAYVVTHAPAKLVTYSEVDVYIVQQVIAKGVKVFGYVASSDDAQERLANIDDMAANGYYGVFFDEAGYDWHVSRATFNSVVDYAHSKGLKVFANAWFPEDVMDNQIDPTYNPDGTPTSLGAGDFYLIESFLTRSDGWTGAGDFANLMTKYVRALTLSQRLGVNVVGLSYVRSGLSDHKSDIPLLVTAAVMLGMHGFAFEDSSRDDYIARFSYPATNLGDQIIVYPQYVSSTEWKAVTDRGEIVLQEIDGNRTATFFETNYNLPANNTYNIGAVTLPANAVVALKYSKDQKTYTNTPARYAKLFIDIPET